VRGRKGKILCQGGRTWVNDNDKKREKDAEEKSKTKENTRIRECGARGEFFFHE
jgi:hypothetical protein